MRFEAHGLIQPECGLVAIDNFQMKGANCKLPGNLFNERHGLLPPAASTVLLAQIELIDKSITAEPFEAVAEADGYVPNRRAVIENDPNAAEIGISQQSEKCHARLFAIVAVAVEGLVSLHEVEKDFAIILEGDAELRFVRHRG